MPRYLELCTLGDLLVRGCERHPDRDALVLPGARLSYRELTERATQVARSLTATGVTRGDRIGLFMPNGSEFIAVLFGILFTGAVAVPVNARFTAGRAVPPGERGEIVIRGPSMFERYHDDPAKTAVHRAGAGRDADRAGGRRALPGRAGQLQGAAVRPVRHRVADVLHQGADLPPARATGG